MRHPASRPPFARAHHSKARCASSVQSRTRHAFTGSCADRAALQSFTRDLPCVLRRGRKAGCAQDDARSAKFGLTRIPPQRPQRISPGCLIAPREGGAKTRPIHEHIDPCAAVGGMSVRTQCGRRNRLETSGNHSDGPTAPLHVAFITDFIEKIPEMRWASQSVQAGTYTFPSRDWKPMGGHQRRSSQTLKPLGRGRPSFPCHEGLTPVQPGVT